MIAEKLELTAEQEEILAHRSSGFPHTAWYVDYFRYAGGYVPWHWHQDVEIMWVMRGGVKVTTPHGSYVVHQGESAFINSNVMHLQESLPGTHTVILGQVFDVSLIAGREHSVFETKYVLPIVQCRQLDVMVFRPNHPTHRQIIEAVCQAYNLADLQNPGYELHVRNRLSEVWLLIYQEAAATLQAQPPRNYAGEERLKIMVTYLHNHYYEKLTLEQIAASASVSQREVLRTFRKGLQTTPFQYLTEIRIRMACRLLRDTNRQITDIALDCGFSSASYFGKVFHELMHTTPMEYRKNSG